MPFVFGALCDQLSDGFGGGDIAAALHVFLRIDIQRGRGGQRRAFRVVDDLRVNMLVAAKHRKTRTGRRSTQTSCGSARESGFVLRLKTLSAWLFTSGLSGFLLETLAGVADALVLVRIRFLQ